MNRSLFTFWLVCLLFVFTPNAQAHSRLNFSLFPYVYSPLFYYHLHSGSQVLSSQERYGTYSSWKQNNTYFSQMAETKMSLSRGSTTLPSNINKRPNREKQKPQITVPKPIQSY